MNTYIDETNAELDEHETKTQRLRGNVSNEIENGETAKEKKVRMKKEKETLQQEVVALIKSLEVRRKNHFSRDCQKTFKLSLQHHSYFPWVQSVSNRRIFIVLNAQS